MKRLRILRSFLCLALLFGIAGACPDILLAQKRVTTKELCARFIKLGLSYRESGDTDNALYFLNKGLNLARQTGSRYWEAASYEGMGLVYKDLRDKPSAVEALLAARRIYTELIKSPTSSSREAIDRIIERTQTMDMNSDVALATEVAGLRNQVESLRTENAALREEIAMLRGGVMPLPPDRESALRMSTAPTPMNAPSMRQPAPLEVPIPQPSGLIDLDALENANAHTSIEAALRNPDAVIKLDLSNNGMRSLPPEIGRFRNLQYLNLSRNQLLDLPPEIGRLTKLQVLNVTGNQLDQLPNEIGNLVNLKQLIVSQNFLKRIPPEVGKLTRLEFFDASENRLTQIPAALGLASSLRDIALRTNFIAFLPAELGKLKRLRTLDVDNNSFTEEELEYLRSILPDTEIISEVQQGAEAMPGEQDPNAEPNGGGQ
jgi:regulator of replication initiation timing